LAECKLLASQVCAALLQLVARHRCINKSGSHVILAKEQQSSRPFTAGIPLLQQSVQWLQVRELIYRELLEYHPHMLADYLSGNRQQPSFMYPSAVDNFKRQFAHLEGGGAYGGAAAGMGGRNNLGQATSLPRERVKEFQNEAQRYAPGQHIPAQPSRAVDTLGSGVRNMSVLEQQAQNGYNRMPADAMGRPPVSQQQQLLRSNSFQ